MINHVSYLVLTAFSEKARVPAWCDRVLWRGKNLRQVDYNVAPLRFSDHRPVYAIFDCAILAIDESIKQKLSRELYEIRSRTLASENQNLKELEDQYGYEPVGPNLDRHKRWLDHGESYHYIISENVQI